jgi:hypothetical protein
VLNSSSVQIVALGGGVPVGPKKESERIFDTDAQLTQEVAERVHALRQVLSRKCNKKVLAIAVGIVTTTKVAFWEVLNKFSQLRHPVCFEIICLSRRFDGNEEKTQ